MGIAAFRKVVVVALFQMALTVAELGAKLLETQMSSLPDLGPSGSATSWPIQICDRT
jgi:hypothetical protein